MLATAYGGCVTVKQASETGYGNRHLLITLRLVTLNG